MSDSDRKMTSRHAFNGFELQKRVGTVDTGRATRAVVTIEAGWDGSRLSIVGDVKRPRARDVDACGQIQDTVASMAGAELEIPAADRDALVMIWRLYHLNDMQAGCVHQRADGWANDRIGDACPICGYRYGSQWLRADVPADVLDRLRAVMSS